jgi:phage-related minor tail protein
MATEIITKMLTMYVFKSLLGLFGGGGGSLFSGQGPVAMPGAGVGGGASMFMPGAPSFRANGGPVTGGSPYVVGERGPELFVPGTGGSVVSNNDLRSAMGSAPGMGGSPVLNMSFETTSIGGVEYVSRDQLELAMAATRRQAARDGAQRGMTMTLDRLQQSPNTRRRVGF